MKRICMIVMIMTIAAVTFAQKTITPNEEMEKIRRGYSPYDMAFNENYHFILEDVSPDKVSIGSPAFLITYDKKKDTYSKNKLPFEYNKKIVHGSYATDKHLFLLYEGKERKSKNYGVFLGQYDFFGKHINTVSVFEMDSKTEYRETRVYQSPDKSFTGISLNENFILINKELKTVYSQDIKVSDVLTAMVSNDGRAWLCGVDEDEGAKLFALNKEGKIESSTNLSFPRGTYSIFMKKDATRENIYLSAMICDNKEKYYTPSTDAKGEAMIIQILNANDLEEKKEVKYQFKDPEQFMTIADIINIGDNFYVLAQPRYTMEGRYADYDMAGDIHLFRINDEEIAAHKVFDRKIQIQRFSFPWMTTPVIKELDGKPHLLYYDMKNAISFKFLLHSGVLGNDLSLTGKKQFETSKMKFIPNHTQIDDNKEMTLMGFHTTGLNWKIGSAKVKF